VFQLLQNQDAGALAHDEAPSLWVLVIGRDPRVGSSLKWVDMALQAMKPATPDLADRSFRPAGDHDVRVAPLNQFAPHRRWRGRR